MPRRARSLVLCIAVAGCGGEISAGAEGGAGPAAPGAPGQGGAADRSGGSGGQAGPTAAPGAPGALPGEPGGSPAAAAPWTPLPAGLRALTSVERARTLRDLLGVDLPLPALAPDDILGGYTGVAARALALSADDVERLAESAAAAARHVAQDPRRRAELTGCQPAGPQDAACAERFVRRFGRLAWRRPLADAEAQRYTRLIVTAGGKLQDFWGGLELGLSALLQSPFFLYLFELGAPGHDAASPRPLEAHELAARLAYVLLNTTPSPALLDAADRGELASPEGLRRQAERLLADARAPIELGRFFDEWLRLERLSTVERSSSAFTSRLREGMREESLRTLRDLVFARDGDFREAMTSRQTFVNGELAKIYGLPAPAGTATAYAPVTLPAGPRAGLFGQASFLTIHAEATRPSAVLRGKAVNDSFLCREVPPPPPEVEGMFPAPPRTPMTAREQLKVHRANPACAGCHNQLDPPGLAFENFDHIGRFRERDGTFPIDPSGELDGAPFRDAAELGARIGESPRFASCVVRQLFRYATGALEGPGQEPRIAALAERFAGARHGVKRLLLELVGDPVFRFVGGAR